MNNLQSSPPPPSSQKGTFRISDKSTKKVKSKVTFLSKREFRLICFIMLIILNQMHKTTEEWLDWKNNKKKISWLNGLDRIDRPGNWIPEVNRLNDLNRLITLSILNTLNRPYELGWVKTFLFNKFQSCFFSYLGKFIEIILRTGDTDSFDWCG